jgi:hypothetical protein
MASSPSLRRGNQPPPLAGYDLFSENRPLVEALRREGGATSEGRCASFGQLCGGEPLELGRLANEHPPALRTHDRFGERIDEAEFPSAYEPSGSRRARVTPPMATSSVRRSLATPLRRGRRGCPPR